MLPTEGQFDNKATPSSPPPPLRTLVAVEISHAVLARDVLPVGAARQRDGLGERLPGVDLEETGKEALQAAVTSCQSAGSPQEAGVAFYDF